MSQNKYHFDVDVIYDDGSEAYYTSGLFTIKEANALRELIYKAIDLDWIRDGSVNMTVASEKTFELVREELMRVFHTTEEEFNDISKESSEENGRQSD